MLIQVGKNDTTASTKTRRTSTKPFGRRRRPWRVRQRRWPHPNKPDNGGGDFLGLAHPSNGFLRNHPLLSLVGASGKAIHHRRGDNAGAHGVDADVLRGVVFQRQLNGSRETKSFDVALSWSVAVSVLFSTLMRIFTVFVFSLGVTRARAESSAPRTAAQPRAITPAIAAVRIKAGNRFRFHSRFV